jgi:hypothetical protein
MKKKNLKKTKKTLFIDDKIKLQHLVYNLTKKIWEEPSNIKFIPFYFLNSTAIFDDITKLKTWRQTMGSKGKALQWAPTPPGRHLTLGRKAEP